MEQVHEAQLVEWSCPTRPLWVPVAIGVEPEACWDGATDVQVPYFTFSIDVPGRVVQVIALDAVEVLADGTTTETRPNCGAKWWPGGSFSVHQWPNGRTSLMWRVRLLDYDGTTGEMVRRVKSMRFRVEHTGPKPLAPG